MEIKKLLIIIILLLNVFYLAAAPTDQTNPDTRHVVAQESKGFDIQGGYNDFFSLKVDVIDAASVQYTAGMPFDLLSEGVNPSVTEHGILIANWSMLTNQRKYTFYVVCDPLKPVTEDTAVFNEPKNTINYILTFIYRLSIYENGTSSKMNTTEFMVASDGSVIDTTPRNPINTTTVIDSQSLMGTTSGEIYLKLTPANYEHTDPANVNSERKIDQAVDGNYRGTVTVRMEIVE